MEDKKLMDTNVKAEHLQKKIKTTINYFSFFTLVSGVFEDNEYEEQYHGYSWYSIVRMNKTYFLTANHFDIDGISPSKTGFAQKSGFAGSSKNVFPDTSEKEASGPSQDGRAQRKALEKIIIDTNNSIKKNLI